MNLERRSFLSGVAGIIATTAALSGSAQVFDSSTQGPGRPDKITDPPRLHPDPKAQLKENDKNLKRHANRLAELAQELKVEADKTDQTGVLSLSLIHRAEEIEKLAKQIKGLARAY